MRSLGVRRIRRLRGVVRNVKNLALLTLVITPTGALAPGPLSASALASGLSLGVLGGVAAALGHLLVELPYVILLYHAMRTVEKKVERYKLLMSLGAALFMFYFAYLLVSSAYQVYTAKSISINNNYEALTLSQALLAGFVLTGFNAHFLLWWVTVGYPLIAESRRLGYLGLGVMYLVHVSMDFAWLAFLATAGGFMGSLDYKIYSVFLSILALFLVFFAIRMIRGELRPKESKVN